ncbi:MAG: tRNA lysidine(34) synthetase TilS [Bacilli bacterium]|nr:tRNA lysidine(34) synthetase TilS [Bacilli bacterium]
MIKINLNKSKRYLLACSFGPDSMALFDLLIRNKYNFEVAHVNYGLRVEAVVETTKLTQYCEEKGIKLHIYKVEEEINRNIEEKCREIRYDFFEKIIEKHRLDALLVAHNQDDNIETFFLQKNRHNIVEKYGLQETGYINNYTVIRPLLGVSKADLLKYCDDNGVPYAIDSSNMSNKFLRNKIRHNVVAKMDANARQVAVEEIKNLNLKLLESHNHIKSQNTKDVKNLLIYNDEELAYHFTMQCRVFIPGFELSLKQVKEFRNVLLSDKPNVTIKLKNGLFFVKSYDLAEIKMLPKETNYAFIIDKPRKFECEYFVLDFTKDTSNRNVKADDYPLTIRNASKEDKVKVKDYYVSMRREFINWKMPNELRAKWPVIVNKDGEIVYVPRYNVNFKPDLNTNFYVKA